MSIEREISLQVDTERMPQLSSYPSVEIRQTYFTPLKAHESYPETDRSEWRIREMKYSNGERSYSSTLKFGDKIEGARFEVESGVEEGAFGTGEERLDFAFGELRKIRYDLGNGLIVDRFLDALDGPEYQAEKEFQDGESQDHWGCPDWLSPDANLLSNRKRAIPIGPKYANGLSEAKVNELQLIDSIVKVGSPAIVTVSGMSGSGKSTIAKRISEKLDAVLVDTDMLHIGVSELMKRYGAVNHDLVGTYDYQRGAAIALELVNGRSAELPSYDYLSGEPTDQMMTYQPPISRNVVVDGLYASEAAKFLRSIDQTEVEILSVHVDTPLYVSVVRRMLRDCVIDPSNQKVERKVAFSPEGSLKYLAEVAIPSYLNADFDKNFDFVVGRPS